MPTERTMQDDATASTTTDAPERVVTVAEQVAIERAPQRNVNTRTREAEARPDQGGKARGRKKHGAGRGATKRARPTGKKKASRTTGAARGGGRKTAKAKKGPKAKKAATKKGLKRKAKAGTGKATKRGQRGPAR
jgi:hypothetical protein